MDSSWEYEGDQRRDRPNRKTRRGEEKLEKKKSIEVGRAKAQKKTDA